MKAKLTVTGLDDYLLALHKAGEDINKISREALGEAGEVLQAEMKRRVPVDTGNLRDHIEIFTPSGEGDFNYVRVGIVGLPDKQTAKQAIAVEFGSVHQASQSYIRSAVRAKRAVIMNLIRERLKTAGMVD